jgi:hypothetical protein
LVCDGEKAGVNMHDVVGHWHTHTPALFETLPDDALLERVQRQTFGFFWDLSHPQSGMARDRANERTGDENTLVCAGGTGFSVMAMIVAVERGWITRADAIARLEKILSFLESADCYRGVFPHYFNANTGEEFTWWQGNAGGDIVETAFLMTGLLSARQYFAGAEETEASLRRRIDRLWHRVEWDFFTDNENVLIWHWGYKHGWATRHRIEGWDECLIAYVLGASSPTFSTGPDPYHIGWTAGRTFRNKKKFYGHQLPLGPDYGGPLFFSHFPFLGLDPRGLKDRYGDYQKQVTAHSLIHYEHCVQNPNGYAGYGPNCWGMTSSDGNEGYAAHQPSLDKGVIAPTAALSSFPYTPEQSMRALKHFYFDLGDRIWGQYGFRDAFNETAGWVAQDYLAIDQGPIVVMMENYRTGLLWRLFMSCPEVQEGLDKLGFKPRPAPAVA